MANHEVISAFLDNESFDARALATSLAEPGGRELLLDLIALRQVVLEDSAVTVAVDVRATSRQRRTWVAAGFLAATVVFGVGASLVAPLLINRSRAAAGLSLSEADAPPTPDHVVSFEPGLDWHENNR